MLLDSFKLDSPESGLLTKTTTVDGESLPVFSIDGERWYSDAAQPAEQEQRRKEFLQREFRELRRHFQYIPQSCAENPTAYKYSQGPQAEVGLWRSVLEIALSDLQSANSRLRQRAHAWFMAHGQETGSFLWVADLLGLDPEAVRRAIGFGTKCNGGQER